MKKPKERLIYEEAYKRGQAKIRHELLPQTPHVRGFVVTEAYLLKAGSVDRDGERLEYQELRIYYRETPEPVSPARIPPQEPT